MFKIGKVFHITHCAGDLDAAEKWYAEIFSAYQVSHNYHAEAMRDASFYVIVDTVFEPLMPAKVPGADQAAMGRFQARYGRRLHSFAWFIENTMDCYDTLSSHNIRLYDVAGRALLKREQVTDRTAIFTHPKDTFGTLEFAHGNFYGYPRRKDAPPPAFWRDQHPLGIQRISHLTILATDLARASRLFEQALGCKRFHEERVAGDRQSAFFALGEDTVMEVRHPLSGSGPTGRELERQGEGSCGVTFKVKSIDKATSFLKSKRMHIEDTGPGAVTVSYMDSFGAVFSFTERSLPNDPRGEPS